MVGTAFHPDEPFVTVHLAETDNGHIHSLDCWCEPSCWVWNRNVHGVLIRVVAHEDYTLHHRNTVIAIRNRKPGWLTALLSRVGAKKGNLHEDDL